MNIYKITNRFLISMFIMSAFILSLPASIYAAEEYSVTEMTEPDIAAQELEEDNQIVVENDTDSLEEPYPVSEDVFLIDDFIIDESLTEDSEDKSSKNTYTVTWNAGEGYFRSGVYDVSSGSSSIAHDYYQANQNLSVPLVENLRPPAEGKYIKGWSVDGTASGMIAFNEYWVGSQGYYDYPVTEDLTFTALWGDIVQLTFDANGQVFDSVPYSSNPRDQYGTLSADRKTVTLPSVSGKILERSFRYYNYADGSVLYYIYPASLECRNSSLSFSHWSTDPEGKNVFYFDNPSGTEVAHDQYGRTIKVGENGMTFYANWKNENEYTTTWDANGGEIGDVDNESGLISFSGRQRRTGKKYTYGETLSEFIWENQLKRDGYVFTGWKVGSKILTGQYDASTGKRDFEAYTVKNDLTLIAQWKRLYTVTWDANGGIIGELDEDTGQVVFSNGIQIKNSVHPSGDYLNYFIEGNQIKRDGYIFTGWKVGTNVFTGQYGTSGKRDFENYRVTGDTVFIAQWENVYTVTWDADGGEIGEFGPGTGELVFSGKTSIQTPKEYRNGDYLDYWLWLFQLRKEGYAPIGWRIGNTDRILREYKHKQYQITGDVTLYAVWTKVVPITFESNKQVFDIDAFYDSENEGTIADDGRVVTMPGLAGEQLKNGWIDYRTNDTGTVISFTWGPVCANDRFSFSFWSTDAEGNNRIEFNYDDQLFHYENGEPVYISDDGLTLYANWEEDWRPEGMNDEWRARAISISAGETKTITFSDNHDSFTLLEFTPKGTLGYKLESYSPDDSIDPDMWFYNEEGVNQEGDYASDEKEDTLDFVFERNLIAGKTYYFLVFHCDESGVVKVSLSAGNHEHQYGDWETIRVASTDSTGLDRRECIYCGYLDNRFSPKLSIPQTVLQKAPEKAVSVDKITIGKKPGALKTKATTKNRATVSWKKFKQTKKTKAIWKKIKKIEIQYSTDKTFPEGILKSKLVGKSKTKYVLKGLKNNTTYYVRIRYKDASDGFSDWSSVKKVKTKK